MRLSERQRECLDRIGIETFSLRRPVPEAEADVTVSATVGSAPALRATAEDATAWAELRAQVAACTQCGLHQGRTQTVFGVGSERAEWMLIGEAPGAEEDRQGEPFVGRAGQLLTSMIVAMGMRREDVWICNILKCRPPSNRDPKPEEVVDRQGPALEGASGRGEPERRQERDQDGTPLHAITPPPNNWPSKEYSTPD